MDIKKSVSNAIYILDLVIWLLSHTVYFHAFSIKEQASPSWLSVMTSGGENLMIFLWVGLAIRPSYNKCFEKL